MMIGLGSLRGRLLGLDEVGDVGGVRRDRTAFKFGLKVDVGVATLFGKICFRFLPLLPFPATSKTDVLSFVGFASSSLSMLTEVSLSSDMREATRERMSSSSS